MRHKKYITKNIFVLPYTKGSFGMYIYVVESQNGQDKMFLKDVASIRTGIVAARKRVSSSKAKYHYPMLNLKCLEESGTLNLRYLDTFDSKDELDSDFFAKKGDVLVRLSTPYTATSIDDSASGILIPSHFVIIRVESPEFNPDFLAWFLRSKSIMLQIYKNMSGSSFLGTINSSFFYRIELPRIPLEEQRIIAEMQNLALKEQDLLKRLAFEKERFNQFLLDSAYNKFKR